MVVGRIVAVLGYSDARADGLHAICAARLRRGAAEAKRADAVVLSGGTRRPGGISEAELMHGAWTGPSRPVHLDRTARLTAENVAHVAAAARALGAEEVRVVTSWWHRPRTALIVRLSTRGNGLRLRTVPARTPWSLRLLLRELGCFVLVPYHAGLARRRLRALAVHAESRVEHVEELVGTDVSQDVTLTG